MGWWVSAPGAILAILTCIGVLDVDDNRHVFLTRQFVFFRPVVYKRVEGGEGRANFFLPKRRGLLCTAGFFPSAGLGAFACAGIRAWCVEGWLCLARRWGWGLGWWGRGDVQCVHWGCCGCGALRGVFGGGGWGGEVGEDRWLRLAGWRWCGGGGGGGGGPWVGDGVRGEAVRKEVACILPEERGG